MTADAAIQCRTCPAKDRKINAPVSSSTASDIGSLGEVLKSSRGTSMTANSPTTPCTVIDRDSCPYGSLSDELTA